MRERMRAGQRTAVLVLAAGILASSLFQVGIMAQQSMALVAVGSGLPESLYLNWNGEYVKAHGRASVRYLPLGMEEGSRQVQKGIADFAGGDYPLAQAPHHAERGNLIQIPVAGVGVAVVYNIPGVQQEIHLSGPVLADIFLSKITYWNHPEIAKLNPGMHLPNLGIMVLHRSEGKGANYVFSDYLSRVSPEFKARVGKSLSPNWVTGTTLARGEDVLFQVTDTQGAIGYVEMDLAMKGKASIALIRNLNGEFVAPSPESVAAALAQSDQGGELRGSVANAPGKGSYPITGLTWLYIPQKNKDEHRQQAVKEFATWIMSIGQTSLPKLGYAPLPPGTAAKAKAQLEALR